MQIAEVIPEDPRWQTMDLEGLCEATAIATFEHLGMGGHFAIAILACDDARIATLNAEFREKPKATNVLSWPSEDRDPCHLPTGGTVVEPRELGDIAIAYETCLAESEAAHIPLRDHATHLIVHAILHLLGYDHEEDDDAALMETTEIAILASLNLENPYDRPLAGP